MKKDFKFMVLISSFLLASCDINIDIGGIGNNSSGSENNRFGRIPLYSEETIKSNIGSYYQSFKITNYDGIYLYDVKYDNSTNTGIVIKETYTTSGDLVKESTEYFFVKGKDYNYVVYYENDFGYGYSEDFSLSLDYLNLIYNISNDILDNAPYASKKEVTYANRKATEYLVSNSKYIIPGDTSLHIILDNETGAILSLAYDYLNFYETSSFSSNSDEASKEVLEKKSSLAFDFLNKETLKLVNLENIQIPNWYLKGATFTSIDGSSDIDSYSVQYYENMPNTDEIVDLCKYVYNQGIKYNYDGEEKSFEELYLEDSFTIDYSWYNSKVFDAYITIDGIKYNVVVSGTNKLSNGDDWYVTLAISKELNT